MFVVLDTNCWGRPNHKLTNPHVDRILEHAGSAGYVVAVPEVVLLECETHIREACMQSLGRLQSAAADVRQWTGKEPLSGESLKPLVESQVSSFKTGLLTKAQLLRIPDVKHETLLRRDLARRKPFDESGRGYRDALIWESILGLLPSSDNPVVFITANSRDFGRDPVHADLKENLERHQQFPDQVTIVSSPIEFLKRFVFTDDARASFLLGQQVRERFEVLQFKIEDAVADALSPFDNLAEALGTTAATLAGVKIDAIGSVDFGEIDGAMQMNGSEQLISFSAEVELHVKGQMAGGVGSLVDLAAGVIIGCEAQVYVDTIRYKVSTAFIEQLRYISTDDILLDAMLRSR